MVRISNKEIPNDKNISISLTYIYGIGKTRSEDIVQICEINPHKKTKDLNESELKKISNFIGEKYIVEDKLRETERKIFDLEVRIGTYKGLRRTARPCSLPVNGQRTRRNARTAKGRKRVTVANKKGAPAPK
jgi:small subunit ribosomal protein S13